MGNGRLRRAAAHAGRAVAVALLALGAITAATMVVPVSGAASAPADPATTLLDEVGPGWTLADAGTPGRLELTTRRFTHDHGEISVSFVPMPPEIDPRLFLPQLARVVADVPPIEGLGIPDSLAFGGTAADGSGSHVVFFAAEPGAFIVTLTSDPDADWDPVELLRSVAEAQLDRAGGPVGGELSPVPERLVPSLATQPPAELAGALSLGTIGGSDDVDDAIGGRADVVRYLDSHTESAVLMWRDAGSDVTFGVNVTEFPFEHFAAVALGRAASGDYEPAPVAGLEDQDVVTFRGTGEQADLTGAAFRRGPLLFVVMAEGADREAVDTAVAAATRQHLDLAPAGASTASHLPSALASIVRSALLVGAAGAVLLGVRQARAARRLTQRSLVDPGPDAAWTIDVDAAASRNRRSALGLVAVQVVAWTTVIVGVAAAIPWWARVVLVAVGAGGGWLITSIWRRRDLGRVGEPMPRRRATRLTTGGLVLLGSGLVALVLGVAGVVWGVRELLFLPSLTHLRLADRVSTEPSTLAVMIGLVGAGVMLAGAALLRAGRARSRPDATSLRNADTRPPILYLRSFEDDDLALPVALSPRRPLTELFTLRTTDPFEESITWELDTYGPVTAVGRPGTDPTSLGAAREFLPNETWKDGVEDRMAAARAIVVVPGTTSGLEWEIAAITSAGHLDKTVFVLPPVEDEIEHARWRTVSGALGAVGDTVDDLVLASVLTVQVADDGPVVTVGRHRDEAGYRAAVDAAMATIAREPVGAAAG